MGVKDNRQNYNGNSMGVSSKDILKGFHWCP